MARMISTDLRPSRPSTQGGPPVSMAWRKSASWSRWPTWVMPRGSLAPALKPVGRPHRREDLVVAGDLRLRSPRG